MQKVRKKTLTLFYNNNTETLFWIGQLILYHFENKQKLARVDDFFQTLDR